MPGRILLPTKARRVSYDTVTVGVSATAGVGRQATASRGTGAGDARGWYKVQNM